MLTDLTMNDFFARLSNRGPVGSGSGAGLVALTGVNLLRKAAVLMKDEKSIKVLDHFAELMKSAIDEDAKIMECALPALMKIGPDGDEKEWNRVLMRATEVPMKIMRVSEDILGKAQELKAVAPPSLICDIQFAALSCNCALQGASLLAELNVSMLSNESDKMFDYIHKFEELKDMGQEILNDILE